MSAQKPKAITQTCWPDQQKTSTEQNMSMSGAINIHYVWPHATNRVGQQHTLAHTQHTHTYVCTCIYRMPNKEAGLRQALVFMAQLPLASRQPGNQSYTHNFQHTHTHAHSGNILRVPVVTRRRSGNVAEIASRPLRYGIEQ